MSEKSKKNYEIYEIFEIFDLTEFPIKIENLAWSPTHLLTFCPSLLSSHKWNKSLNRKLFFEIVMFPPSSKSMYEDKDLGI